MGAPQLAHRPAVSRQSSSHGRRALLPLPAAPCGSRDAQTLMQPTAVIRPAAQPHPSPQDGLGVGEGAPSAYQGAPGTCGRTAVAHQGEGQRHQVGRRPQAVVGGAWGGCDGLATRRAPISLLESTMHPNVSGALLPSGRALGVVQNWVCGFIGGLPWTRSCSPKPITSGRMPEGPACVQASVTSPRLDGVVPFRVIRMADVHYREAERLIQQHGVRGRLRTLDAL